MKKIIFFLIAVTLCFSLVGIKVHADDIENDIEKARTAYKEGKYSESITSLDSASQKIRKIKASKIEIIFPDALSGWRAEKPESRAIGSMFMGGAISASRVYRKNNTLVRIDVVSDSPIISMVTGVLSNPMVAAASPMLNIQSIKGESALVEWDKTSEVGSVKIVIDNKVLVTISGENCTKANLISYAEAIDYEKVKSFS